MQNVLSRFATCPFSWTVAFELTVGPVDLLELDIARPDVLNQPLAPPTSPFGLQVDAAVGYAESFSIRNDGPAVCRFTRLFTIPDVPGPFVAIDNAPINIASGAILNRLTMNEQFIYPAFPFTLLRFQNTNALNPFTVHVVYTLRAL